MRSDAVLTREMIKYTSAPSKRAKTALKSIFEKTNKMRYALRNQDKIAAALGDDYLQNHLIASLDCFFRLFDGDAMNDFWIVSSGTKYPILRINDINFDGAMLEFAVIERRFDVLRLAYIGQTNE